MAPKRKRAEDTTAKATRASSRLKASSSNHSGAASPGVSVSSRDDGNSVEPEPATKKARRATTKAASFKADKNKTLADQQEPPNEIAGTSRSNGAAGGSTKSGAASQTTAPEPYSEARAKQFFKTYADPDTPGEIGPEGFEKLCSDLDISLEGAQPLILAWQLNGSEMAKFTEEEWMKGTGELRVSSPQTLALAVRDLEDLLLLDKPPIQPPTGAGVPAKKKAPGPSANAEPYDRRKYYQYAADKEKAFSELYTFCFNLAKPPTGRNIDMDTASAFWSVLVAPRYPLMNDILKFIAEKGTYKGVNKDLWTMTLEFCRTVHPDLSNYEADGAWPTMLDDFVLWKKASSSTSAEDQDVDIV